MTVKQAEFVAAVLDSELPVPSGLLGNSKEPTKRFSVYRNNVVVSLIDALGSSFPVIRNLVGDEFFEAMAGVFVRQFPPVSPVLLLFGTEFPAFLTGFGPVAHLPYLPDVARLELLIRESYHEEDSAAVPLDVVTAVPADRLPESRLELAPSLRLLRSAHPVCSIWRANVLDGPKPSAAAESVIVVRKEFDPEPALLPPSGFELVTRLAAGASLLAACEYAESRCGEARLDETLSLLVSFNAVTAISAGEESRGRDDVTGLAGSLADSIEYGGE